MIKRDQLIKALNEYLRIDEFSDLGPNGLQVEGRGQINTIITGVSASVELFQRAIALGADAIIVHHGIIWNFERPVYKGAYKKRVKMLLENDITLLAYHLPLDAHPEVGNNAVIAKKLGLGELTPFGEYKGTSIGVMGRFEPARDARAVMETIKKVINPEALFFPFGPEKITRVGIISGGAQKEALQAINLGLDMYITGEVSEFNMHQAKEEGLHFVAAGHHATERFGIQALSDYLNNQFAVQVKYVEVENPV